MPVTGRWFLSAFGVELIRHLWFECAGMDHEEEVEMDLWQLAVSRIDRAGDTDVPASVDEEHHQV